MMNTPISAEVADLFGNNDPDIVWGKVTDVIRRINPNYDFTLISGVYDDIVGLFRGHYPGYCAIKTLYHDISHTLEVLMCGVRLMHGVHLSGDLLSDEEITQMLSAILMHDVGYAQRVGEDKGTGAQYTLTHVQRGVEFMRHYFKNHNLPSDVPDAISTMIMGTEHMKPFTRIEFKSERERMLARIVATADITGQMADRAYLEKLLFLYLEFKEAQFGNYHSMYELLRQTNRFYEVTRVKLDDALGGIYHKLEFHFKDSLGVGTNYYLESIEKNINYLQKIVAQDEAAYLSMLKRKGIAEKSLWIAQHSNFADKDERT